MSHQPGEAHGSFPGRFPGRVPVLGLVLAGGLAATMLVGPMLLTTDPLAQDLGAAFAPPSADWLLGADQLGRSVLVRVVSGARVSLGVALLASLVTAALGTALGLLAAAWGGWRARAVLLLADVAFACPAILVVLLVAGLFGGGIWAVAGGTVLTQWPAFARVCVPLARGALAAPDAEGSRLLGFRAGFLVRRHALPAVLATVVSLAALQLATNVLLVSSVGFLGIGLAPPRAEWGIMVAEALPYLRDAPHMLAAPAVALMLATLSATLIGEALADRVRGGADTYPVDERA